VIVLDVVSQCDSEKRRERREVKKTTIIILNATRRATRQHQENRGELYKVGYRFCWKNHPLFFFSCH